MNTFPSNNKILYVDDEANLLSAFAALMRKENVETVILRDATSIDTILREKGPFAVVLSDQRMPEVDGVEILERVASIHPDTVRVMVTGYAEHADTMRAINEGGISHYVAKPWRDSELKKLVRDCVERFNMKAQNKFLLEELQVKNKNLSELLEGTVLSTARILSDVLGYVNSDAAAQVERVRRLGKAILSNMPEIGLTERWEILLSLDLFNLGIALLPGKVQWALQKQGLDAASTIPFARTHHILAAGLLKDILHFENIARIIALQEKNFDGTGEPVDDRTAGKDIPLGSRLLRILKDLDQFNSPGLRGSDLLRKMIQQPSKYDVDLIVRIIGEGTSGNDELQQMSVVVTDLKPGMIVLQDVVTSTGQYLLGAQSVVTETYLNILLQWNYKDPIPGPILVRIT